jgi:hypothetical protein
MTITRKKGHFVSEFTPFIPNFDPNKIFADESFLEQLADPDVTIDEGTMKKYYEWLAKKNTKKE